MKPRLTDRVLRGLNKACARAYTDLEAVYEDQPWLREEAKEVDHAWTWVQKMIRQREEKKGTGNE